MRRFKKTIDDVTLGEFDAILLAYGMCGNATVGLHSGHTPLVTPRAHDCITLYLGSKDRYQSEFNKYPGTFWYSVDYMERIENGESGQLGAAGIAELEDQYENFVQKYGKKRADFLIEEIKSWTKHYERAVFVDTGLGDVRTYEEMAINRAEREGWIYERMEGDRRLIQMLVDGNWPEDEFLIIQPGQSIEQSFDSGIIRTTLP